MKKVAATFAARKQLTTHLGRTLLRARMARGLSISDLARKTHWSRSYITHLENGQRGAEPGTLIALAQILEIDPLALLHAAYRDRLDIATRAALPGSELPTVVLNYMAARELQESQFEYRIGVQRYALTGQLDGSVELRREYASCRPSFADQPVDEILLQERAVGVSVNEYEGDTLEVKAHPDGLVWNVRTEVAGGWVRRRIVFPQGWLRASRPEDDMITFEYRRRYANVFAKSPTEYVTTHKIESVEQAFVGKASLYLSHLVDRLEGAVELPQGDEAESWRLHITWGRDLPNNKSLAWEGICRSLKLETSPKKATLVVDRPLVGYTISLQWVPASLAAFLDQRSSEGS